MVMMLVLSMMMLRWLYWEVRFLVVFCMEVRDEMLYLMKVRGMFGEFFLIFLMRLLVFFWFWLLKKMCVGLCLVNVVIDFEFRLVVLFVIKMILLLRLGMLWFGLNDGGDIVMRWNKLYDVGRGWKGVWRWRMKFWKSFIFDYICWLLLVIVVFCVCWLCGYWDNNFEMDGCLSLWLLFGLRFIFWEWEWVIFLILY